MLTCCQVVSGCQILTPFLAQSHGISPCRHTPAIYLVQIWVDSLAPWRFNPGKGVNNSIIPYSQEIYAVPPTGSNASQFGATVLMAADVGRVGLDFQNLVCHYICIWVQFQNSSFLCHKDNVKSTVEIACAIAPSAIITGRRENVGMVRSCPLTPSVSQRQSYLYRQSLSKCSNM